MKKLILPIIVFLSALSINTNAYADELTGSFTLSNGGDVSALTDDSHYSVVNFTNGDTITITSTCKIKSVIVDGVLVRFTASENGLTATVNLA